MTQRPIATISVPEGREGVKFEVMREIEKGGDWHNRYVRHAETKEVLYYCTREPDMERNDTKLIFHRGGKDGPVIATADPCERGKYKTDIHFVEPKMTVPLEHRHDTKTYCATAKWLLKKGHKEIEKDEADGIVATYHPSPFEGKREVLKVGTLNITVENIQDLVVVTALVVQEREEETKGPSAMYWQRLSELKP